MKFNYVNDIVPYLTRYIKSGKATAEPLREWNANDFLDCGFANLLDFDRIEQDESIRFYDRFPHNGNYASDETHCFAVLIFKGEIAIVIYQIGDTSEWNNIVVNPIAYGELTGYMMSKYMKPVTANSTSDISRSTSSYLQRFIESDGVLYSVVHDPSWGMCGGRDSEGFIFEIGEDDNVNEVELTLVGKVASMKRYRLEGAWRDNGSIVTLDNGTELKIEKWGGDTNFVYAVKID